MHYEVFLSTEGKQALAEFPDCPGCQTFSEKTPRAIGDALHDALNGWLEAHLIDGQVPPRPMVRTNAPPGKTLLRVPVRPPLASALMVRWARQDAGLSQKELGKLARVSQQQIAKLENPDMNPSLETLDKVGRALGLTLDVSFAKSEDFETQAAFAVSSVAARGAGRAHGRRASGERKTG
jgi:DNA-binding XRE family transcriptional regulator/predicted RNase H-like HicB family nuclease